MPPSSIIGMFKGSYKVIIAVVITIAFFLGYNEFLIDRSLESLNFALSEASAAQSLNDVRELGLIVDSAIVKEISPQTIDSTSLANLTFAQNTIISGKLDQQIQDIQFLLKEVAQKKNSERGIFLRALDKLSSFIVSLWGKIIHLPNLLWKKKISVEEITVPIPPEAQIYENALDYEKAKQVYEKFINEYPNSPLAPTAKLRLAYVYQKTGNFKKAEPLYNDLINNYYGTKQAGIAKRMLWYINELRKYVVEKEYLLKKLRSPVISKEEMQVIYYRLGTINTSLYLYADAEEAFRKAAELEPQSVLAIKSEFNIAINYKFQNKFEKSREKFDSLIKDFPNSVIAPDAKYQIADTYYREQKYDEAIKELQELSKQYGYSPLGALAQFQAGYIYLVDKNDVVSARQIFEELAQTYPSLGYTKFIAEMTRLKPTFNIFGVALARGTLVLIHRLTRRNVGEGDYQIPFDIAKTMHFNADVRAEDLNIIGENRHKIRKMPILLAKSSYVYKYHFDFKDNKVWFSFQAKIVGFPKLFDCLVVGHYQITKDKNFVFKADKGRLGPIPIPGFVINLLTKIPHTLIHEAKLPYIFYRIDVNNQHFIAEGLADEGMIEKINDWWENYIFSEIRIKYTPATAKEIEEMKKLRGAYLAQRRHWDIFKAETFLQR